MKTLIKSSIEGLFFRSSFILLNTALACFVFLPPKAFGVVPAPDGGYPNWNTAEGTNALFHLTSGIYNTALGGQALFSDTSAGYNTGVGVNALFHNNGFYNTATGVFALLSNTTGTRNTANGVNALRLNIVGSGNTAIGTNSLYANSNNFNTAIGGNALFHNTSGSANTASGVQALEANTSGFLNTANGYQALIHNTSGINNTALGSSAGTGVTTANNVIVIGTPGFNVSNSCFIGNIYGQMAGFGTPVYINSSGQLGTSTSSQRFKDNIKPMDEASEVLFALKPVTFRYKKELDPAGTPQFGLVAEEVEKINPDLVVRDADGKVNTVRYEQINAMLLNEFLKEHKKVEQQEATITDLKTTITKQQKNFESKLAEQEKQIRGLASGLQKVSAQVATASPFSGELAINKASLRTALKDH